MTGTTEAIEGIAGLLFGGFLFVAFGTALANSTAVDPMIDLRFWGIIYILAAIVLTVGTVYALVLSIVK
jgi:hypothetical protein